MPPFAIRAQAFAQGREAESLDKTSGPTGNNEKFDIQAPYLIKLLSSTSFSDHLTYYFYCLFVEKGDNGKTIIEDAWITHDDVFDSGISMTLSTAYYYMRNVKGVIEANMDFLSKDNEADFVGHTTKENALLAGFDLAF